MGVVWFFTTYQKRETEGPLHHPSPPESSDHWSIIAFLLGWAGTACYNVPRALLLYETVWVVSGTPSLRLPPLPLTRRSAVEKLRGLRSMDVHRAYARERRYWNRKFTNALQRAT